MREQLAEVIRDGEGTWRTPYEAADAILEAGYGKIGPVLALADFWESRGEHDMAFSKTIADEDIAVAILTDGATKVENARHIRNAINGHALEDS